MSKLKREMEKSSNIYLKKRLDLEKKPKKKKNRKKKQTEVEMC